MLRILYEKAKPCGQISLKNFDVGRSFCTKLWNATRYIIMNIKENDNIKMKIDLNIDNYINDFDKWILYKLAKTKNKMENFIGELNFSQALKEFYDFFWNDFCNMYLEINKNPGNKDNINNKIILLSLINVILRLLHPFIPFITEELWSYLSKYFVDHPKSIMNAKWPIEITNYIYDCKLVKYFIGIISEIRSIKLNAKQINIEIYNTDTNYINFLETNKKNLIKLTKINDLKIKLGKENKINII